MPKVTRGVKRSSDSSEVLTLQPEVCLHPRFPVSHVGSPRTYSYTLPTPPPSLPTPPPMVPWVDPPHILCKEEGKGLLACSLIQWPPCTPTDETPHEVALPFTGFFLTELDWGAEYLPLVVAHLFLPSSLPSANIHDVLTSWEAPSRVPGMSGDRQSRSCPQVPVADRRKLRTITYNRIGGHLLAVRESQGFLADVTSKPRPQS